MKKAMMLTSMSAALALALVGCKKTQEPGAESAEHAGQPATAAKAGTESAEHGSSAPAHAGQPATPGTKSAEHPGEAAEHPGEAAEHPGEAAEHAGKAAEHAGKAAEHAGKAAEHAGKAAEHAGKKARGFTAEQIKAAMTAHIHAEVKKGGGVLKIADPKTKEDLSLQFVKIHDPVRQIEGKGYFACTDFHPLGAAAEKLYDLDFWLNPKDNKLVVTETKIHKHPVRKGSTWEKKARYTFVDDNPVEVK